jgi:ABC-type transport system involved in multi-copper enzyme maturation permease subunit
VRRNLAFEWIRARTLRSTWGFPLMGIAVATAITVVILVISGSPEADFPAPTLRDLLANAANPLALVLTTTICAQAFGHEYRDGTMRLVLSEFPDRSRVFLAKLLVPALLVAGSVLLAAGIASVIGTVQGVGAGGGAGQLLGVLGRQVVVAIWWGLMVAGITALMRNLAAGIVTALVLSAVFEGLLIGLLGTRAPWLDDVLPFTTATQWAASGAVAPGLVALAWVVALVGAAWTGFLRRDA